MTFEEARNVVKGITYKPSNNKHGGWLHFNKLNDSFYRLTVSITNPDSYNKEGVVAISATFEKILSKKVLEALTPYFLISMVRDLIIQGELHEVDEFIEYNGIKLFDPHKEKDLCSK